MTNIIDFTEGKKRIMRRRHEEELKQRAMQRQQDIFDFAPKRIQLLWNNLPSKEDK